MEQMAAEGREDPLTYLLTNNHFQIATKLAINRFVETFESMMANHFQPGALF